MRLHRGEERLHLALLVDDVVCGEEAAGVQPRVDHIEELLVVRLPRIEEDEIESAWQLGNLLERVAMNHLHDVGQAGKTDVVYRFLRALRVVLDRHNASARFSRAETEPDAAVPAGGADLEDRLCA